MKLTEITLKEINLNPLHDMLPDSILMSAGRQLQVDLGLAKFKKVFIQKVLGQSLPIYVITFNSRYPNVTLSATRVKKLKFTWIAKAKRSGLHTRIKPVKLTPPLYLESAMIRMTSNSIIVFRDLAGEYLRQPRMFAYTDKQLDKKGNGL